MNMSVSKALVGLMMASALAGCASAPGRLPPIDTAHYGPKEANAWKGSTPALIESYGQVSPRQFGELRVPKGRGPFPVAMLVHGGCYAGMGSTANLQPMADWLMANGVATWNVSYRDLASGGGWPASFQDWAGGLAALKELAGRFPLDLKRVSVVGHSAGATPAMWLASGSQGDGVVAGDLPDVRASVILDGPTELGPLRDYDEAICGRPVIDELMGGTPEKVPARYKMVDPRLNPPVIAELLIVDGALGSPDPALLDFLRSKGAAVETIVVAQDEHFDHLKPGTPDFAKIAPALLRVTRGR